MLGCGAIGSIFAEGLHDSGCPVTVLARATRSPSVEIRIERDDSVRTIRLPCSDANDDEPISHLLVTTKAYDVVPALNSVSDRLTAESQVLVMANGMGFAQELATASSMIRPYFGTTTEGAHRSEPYRVQRAGGGSTLIGRGGQSTAPDWFDDWRDVTDDCRWEADIELALWRKLAVNCAINPLSAINNCRNAELLERESLRHQLHRLCLEIAQVCRAAGYPAVAENLPQVVERVIHGTASNYSSMLQDLRAGRRTEIDYITGYLVNIAENHGIDVPANRALLGEIQKLGNTS